VETAERGGLREFVERDQVVARFFEDMPGKIQRPLQPRPQWRESWRAALGKSQRLMQKDKKMRLKLEGSAVLLERIGELREVLEEARAAHLCDRKVWDAGDARFLGKFQESVALNEESEEVRGPGLGHDSVNFSRLHKGGRAVFDDVGFAAIHPRCCYGSAAAEEIPFVEHMPGLEGRVCDEKLDTRKSRVTVVAQVAERAKIGHGTESQELLTTREQGGEESNNVLELLVLAHYSRS
jgi:hypothetical protein